MLAIYKVESISFPEDRSEIIKLVIDLFNNELFKTVLVKLIRLQAPKEEEEWNTYKHFIIRMMNDAKEVKVVLYPSGVNSRVFLADLVCDGKSVNKELIAAKLVKQFHRKKGKTNG